MASPITPSLLRRLTLLDYPLPLKLHAYLLLSLGVGLTFLPRLIVLNPLFKRSSELLGIQPEVPSSVPLTGDERKDDEAARSTSSNETPKSSSSSTSSSSNKTLHTTTHRNLSITGLLALGLGLSYVGSSAFSPSPEQNQLLYASIPLRVAMSATAMAAWVGDERCRSVFMGTVILEDALGAAWLGWWMRGWPLWGVWRG